MNVWEAALLGVIEGLTEFLPVSSTGHLTIVERALGMSVDDPAVTAFTAVVQLGAIGAVFLYFFSDLRRMAGSLLRGAVDPQARKSSDFTLAFGVLLGSLPIGIVGLAARGLIEGPLRSLWVVAGALIGWSFVMLAAERFGKQTRSEGEVRVYDALLIGCVQCVALVPGVSRSGATISAALLRGLDRVTATRLSFFLALPAVTAAGLLQLPQALNGGIGPVPLLVGVAASFSVAYLAISMLLKFVARHSIVAFVPYRIAVGLLLIALLLFVW